MFRALQHLVQVLTLTMFQSCQKCHTKNYENVQRNFYLRAASMRRIYALVKSSRSDSVIFSKCVLMVVVWSHLVRVPYIGILSQRVKNAPMGQIRTMLLPISERLKRVVCTAFCKSKRPMVNETSHL